MNDKLCNHTTTEGSKRMICTEPAGHAGAHFGKPIAERPPAFEPACYGEQPGIQDGGLIQLAYLSGGARPHIFKSTNISLTSNPPYHGYQCTRCGLKAWQRHFDLITRWYVGDELTPVTVADMPPCTQPAQAPGPMVASAEGGVFVSETQLNNWLKKIHVAMDDIHSLHCTYNNEDAAHGYSGLVDVSADIGDKLRQF